MGDLIFPQGSDHSTASNTEQVALTPFLNPAVWTPHIVVRFVLFCNANDDAAPIAEKEVPTSRLMEVVGTTHFEVFLIRNRFV